MKANIYQAKNPTFRSYPEGQQITTPEIDACFDCVAAITFSEGDAAKGVDYLLEVAYEKTNHIDQAWWEATGIEVKKQGRSTSVGDLVVLESSHGDKAIYGCAATGWVKLGYEE